MQANLSVLQYHEMTPIQAKSLPVILSGRDVLAQAKTGSGKTVAFSLGILARIEACEYRTQALILCPTRELADQVSKEIRQLARVVANIKIMTLCGGTPIAAQLASLEHSPHIVVGTPGRIKQHLSKGSLSLKHLKALVLDEADRMLDMGFQDDIEQIIKQTPAKKQTLLFSATYAEEIQAISQHIQTSPEEIRTDTIHDRQQIKQVFYEIQKGKRSKTLLQLLQHYRPLSCIIFCNRKQQCQELADDLWEKGFHALALHGDLEQREREQVLVQFTNKSSSILVATDVAARGLDIKDLEAVINYELSPDPEIHIHRIGRTGRAGKEGLAINLFMTQERFRIEAIEAYQGHSIDILPVTGLKAREYYKPKPPMVCLSINGGRKDKVRAGDILGAITANKLIPGKQIGKIDVFDKQTFVAVERPVVKQALKILNEGKIKGRKFKARKLP